MVLENIVSIVNIRLWTKRKNWKSRKLIGKACINYYKNGVGGRCSIVRTNKDGTRSIFDLPIEALIKLSDIVRENQKIKYRAKKDKSWRLIDWRKKANGIQKEEEKR